MKTQTKAATKLRRDEENAAQTLLDLFELAHRRGYAAPARWAFEKWVDRARKRRIDMAIAESHPASTGERAARKSLRTSRRTRVLNCQ